MFENLDKKNLEMGMENATTWINQKKQPKSIDVVEALYTPQIIVAKDDKYPSTFKFKLPMKNGKLGCDVYDKNMELIDLLSTDLTKTKGSKCKAIMQCTGIWLAGSKFGMSWKCVQLQISQQENFGQYSFKNIPDDDIAGEDIEEVEDKSRSSKKQQEKSVKSVVQNNEDEEDEECDAEESDIESDDDDDDDDDVPVVAAKKK